MSAIGTPVQAYEGDPVSRNNVHTHTPLHVPQPEHAICAVTEQAATIGREGQTLYVGTMPVQHGSTTVLFSIPEPDLLIGATGQGVSIRTPGQGLCFQI